jgi:hypothetical protein
VVASVVAQWAPLLSAVEASALAEWIRRSTWAYPGLEIVHIASFATLIGSLVVLELRVFGLARAIDPAALARLALPVTLLAFAGAACSGALLFVSNAAEFAGHPAFQAKLALIAAAGVNALVFHLRRGIERHDRVARVQAALSLLVWLAIISAGRLIAYL